MKRILSILMALVMATTYIQFSNNGIAASAASINLSASEIANYFNSRVGGSYSSGWCLAFVADGFAALGAERSSACCAYIYGASHITSNSQSNIPVGADVFFFYTGIICDVCGNNAGHVGVYVGDGYVVHAAQGIVKKQKLTDIAVNTMSYRGWGYHGNIAITGIITNRIAAIGTDGTLYVKEDSIEAAWVEMLNDVSQVSLSGNRIAALTTDSKLFVKEGSIDVAWVEVLTGVSQVSLSGNRIAVITTDNKLYVKEGSLEAPWVNIFSWMAQVSLSGNRIAALTTDNNLYIKEGSLDVPWVEVKTGVVQVSLSGNRIAALTTDNILYIKEGSIEDAWVEESPGVAQAALSGNRIAALTTDNKLRVKEGSLEDAWVEVLTGVAQATLSGNRIAVLTTDEILYVKEGGLEAAWVNVRPWVAQATLQENSSGVVISPPTLFSPSKTDTTVNLSWNAVNGATSYNLYIGSTKLNTSPITHTNYLVSGLTSNSTYSFTVRAFNPTGQSKASNVLNITTKPAIPTWATVKTNKNIYAAGETITFTVDSDNASSYGLGIDKDNVRVLTPTFSEKIYQSAFTTSGLYSVYVSANNSAGGFDSEKIYFTIFKYGDVNGDNNVSVVDALMALHASSGNTTLNAAQILASDVTKDGKTSVLDALKILQYSSGLITSFS